MTREHDDDAPDDRDERFETIAQVVVGFLREGEALSIELNDGEVTVTPEPISALKRRHPRLYGRLLSVEEQLNVGCAGEILMVFAAVASCLALHFGAFDRLFGNDFTAKLDSWWVYLLWVFFVGFIGSRIMEARVVRSYRRSRDELAQHIHDEGFDRDSLLAALESNDNLSRVTIWLKLDNGPFPPENGAKRRLA